ncbi:hypothetical protein CJF32_00006910 [Rutstroemia sp. NJR-2017a WRK4]|nr:hypothetical protein CJF32_00006910 [Rutstroemia sp. NJR-2017a WRK4]
MTGAPSLLSTATKACIRNVNKLEDIGDLEYWKIRHILKQIKSPEQLHTLEVNCPHIAGEDAELWQAFIARDFPSSKTKNYVPKNPVKWYQVYMKYKKEHKIEIERDREILRNTMAGLKKHKESHLSKVVDIGALPKIPRDPRMRANDGGVPLKGKGFAKAAPSSLMWGSGSRTKMTDGASVLTKARREAKEITQRTKLSVPTNMLSGRLGQVKKAPEGMRNAYRTAAQPALKILAKHRTTGGAISGGIRGPSLEEREKRLRAAMAGAKTENPGVKQTYVGSSDDDAFNDDDDDTEDLFGDTDSRSFRPSPPPRKIARPVAPSTHKLSSSAASSKPSDMISAMISNKSATQSPASSARPSPSPADSRSSTPRPTKMMAPRKREVDIFSRKKPRLR